MITNQTKWAIAKMKEAGWARKDFRARTETRRWTEQGIRCTEYGNTRITLTYEGRPRSKEMIAPMLKAGLNVTVIMLKGKFSSVLVNDNYPRTGLTLWIPNRGEYGTYEQVPTSLQGGK